MVRGQVLFLKVGDRVFHKKFGRWGMGTVVEERASQLPGGFCYVRISFRDGHTRVFDNNLKSDCCCYYAGIEKIEEDKRLLDVDKYEKRYGIPRRKKALGRGED